MSVLWFSRPDAWNVTSPVTRPNSDSEPDSQPSYLLLAPAGLRPGLPSSVSVTILGSSSVSVSAEIVYENETLSSNSTTIKGGIHQVGSSPGRTYTLKVRGHRGPVQLFSNSTELHVDPRGVSTFIQTNQPRYLPGQMVKIRTVSVRSDGKPCSEPADVLIRDPRGNLLRQWLDKDGVLGVVSTEFQLSENPPLGEWSIMATIKVRLGRRSFNRTFCVPDETGPAVFCSRYFYGKPVRGRMVVTFSHRYHGDNQTHSEEAEVRKRRQDLMQNVHYGKNVKERFYNPSIIHPSIWFFLLRLLQVGSRLWLRVEKNFQIPDVHYLVKSRGQVVSAGRSSGDVSLVPEVSWAPLASVIVYCVHPGGEVINDVIHLPITHFLQNKVSLSWSSDLLKPAEVVTLKVSVEEPDSLVGILVVDKATRWAGSNNDITMETVRTANTAFDLTRTQNQQSNWFLLALIGSDWFFLLFPGAGADDGVRQNFPETWVWMDVNTGMQIPLPVPDSITTWTASAFVVSENLGLGLTEKPAELTVFQDFFLSLNLPAYIIRGEELVLEVVLFNYLQEELEVSLQSCSHEAVAMASVRRLLVEPEGGATVLVPIRPLVLGDVPIAVKAVSSAAADFVRTTVLVKAEGRPQSFSSSLLLDLPAGRSGSVAFRFPAGVVDGSQRVSVTAIGDLLGPSISGLDSLVQMPFGCGEQNMIHFAPNVYVLRYLSARGPLDPALQNRATDYMLKGSTQNQQNLPRREPGRDGSVLRLTAFVLRCLLQARPWVGVDGRVLESAAAWLAAQRAAGGAAAEPGTVIHSELQGGLDGPVSLTAYVLVALLEDGSIRVSGSDPVLVLSGVSSNYSLSLLSYALALAGSPASHAALNRLIGRADLRDGVPTWSSPDAGLSSSWQPRSADIEIASYVLLSLYELNRVDEGLSLMQWLSQQRNHLGGYGSTQDTVVALQALSTFAALQGSEHSDLDVTVTNVDSGVVASFHIDQNNFLLYLLASMVTMVTAPPAASSSPSSLFQLNVFYNIRSEELLRRRGAEEQEAFYLKVALFEEQNEAHLFVCTSLARHLGLNETGMVLMEVGLLSGFSAQPDLVPLGGAVKRVETEPGRAVLYLDSESCLLVPLLVEFKVARVQEASVSVYDYYEPRKVLTVRSYRSSLRSDVSSCSFCGEDCSRCRANNDSELDAASRCSRHFLLRHFLPALLLLFVIFSA
uniref:CD109 molecule n=1 Tax=Poecilia latipinna TaxID=48699 RepID=A0A3B3TY14_9TELE